LCDIEREERKEYRSTQRINENRKDNDPEQARKFVIDLLDIAKIRIMMKTSTFLGMYW